MLSSVWHIVSSFYRQGNKTQRDGDLPCFHLYSGVLIPQNTTFLYKPMHNLAEFYIIYKFSVSLTSYFLTVFFLLHYIQWRKKLKLIKISLGKYKTFLGLCMTLSFILSRNLQRQLAIVTVMKPQKINAYF